MSEPILPDVNDPVSMAFWTAAREHRLVAQRCSDCGAQRYPPLPDCPECLSFESTWTELRPTGTIWSYAIYHRALNSAFADEIPYTIAVVDLDDGLQITGRLVRTEEDVVIGSRVSAVFYDVTPEVTLIQWRIVS